MILQSCALHIKCYDHPMKEHNDTMHWKFCLIYQPKALYIMCAIQKLSWFNNYKACFQLADYEPLRPSLEAMICPDPSCEDKAAVSTALKCQPTWDIWSRCNWYNGCSALFSLWTERGRNDQIHAQGTGQQGLTLTWQGHTCISDSYSSLHQPDVPASAIWTHVQKRAIA